MKSLHTYLLFCFSIWILSSCSRGLSPIAYIEYVEDSDNGLNQEVLLNNTKLILQYKPLDYIVVQEIKKQEIKKEEFNKVKDNQGEGYIYFNLKLSIDQGSGWSDPSKKDTYHSVLMSELKEQIHLKLADREIPVSIYYLETGMGIFPYSTALLGFEMKENNKEDLVLQIQKNKLIPYPTTLIIKQEDIKNTPVLKLI